MRLHISEHRSFDWYLWFLLIRPISIFEFPHVKNRIFPVKICSIWANFQCLSLPPGLSIEDLEVQPCLKVEAGHGVDCPSMATYNMLSAENDSFPRKNVQNCFV